MHGSITLVQSLLQAGLVDELRLVVVPTIAHGGRRLFPEGPACRRLDLVNARTSSTVAASSSSIEPMPGRP